MKKIIYIVFLLLCISFSVAGQTTVPSNPSKWHSFKESDSVLVKVKKVNSDLIEATYKVTWYDECSFNHESLIRISDVIYFVIIRHNQTTIRCRSITPRYYQVVGDNLHKKSFFNLNTNSDTDLNYFRIPNYTELGSKSNVIIDSVSYWVFTKLSKVEFRRQYRRLRFQKKNQGWDLSFNYLATGGYRTLFINTPQYSDLNSLSLREKFENPIWSHSFSVQVNFYLRPHHALYVEGLYFDQGFESVQHSVNWQTGYPGKDNSITRYSQRSLTIGAGYHYCNYSPYRQISLTGDLGIYMSGIYPGNWGKMKIGNNLNPGEKRVYPGIKAGVGLNYSPCFRIGFTFLPVLYYNLLPVSGGDIRTTLWNAGVQLGVNWHFVCSK